MHTVKRGMLIASAAASLIGEDPPSGGFFFARPLLWLGRFAPPTFRAAGVLPPRGMIQLV